MPSLFRSRVLRRAGKLARLLPDAKFRRGLRRGVGAAIEHRALLAGLDLRTIVDIGANAGQFSLFAWSQFPEARIYAFEPLARPAAVFARLFRGVPQVSLVAAAISAQAGRARMHVARRDDSSSLLPVAAATPQLLPGTETVGAEAVAVAPLGDFLTPQQIVAPALLKLDVQGAEREALQGCEELLRHFAYVEIELSFIELYEGQPLAGEMIRFLDRRGFSLTAIANLATDRAGRPLQADFLFARDNPEPPGR